ncbi:SGNH/GDSL hydrolase family protein [Cohnella nanjingensis]|uniref:SGNH/GDSL hydrolase family protein n=1 Tax=Cohnella nanjingensis TaxID=1387779 RepID=A0A7X0RMB8_9BACL|nr:SGNH/GDSL hydrolase family protein [Cohnella nanjingensis]MBB6669996.1 SGNH/GDSL hydrolase family protein [Cohnella nanjingensis]
MNGQLVGGYTLRELAEPFWKGDRVYAESVLPLSAKTGEAGAGRLLYEPDNIIEVRNARLDVVYEEGRDWVLREERLLFPTDSRIPITSLDELFPAEPREGWVQERKGGGYSLFSEGHFFHDKQIAVSYTCRKERSGPAVFVARDCPPRTARKLAAGDPLQLLVFGDSIAEGANASGMTGAPPYLPTWGEIVVRLLGETYGTEIEYRNGSVGGITSEGGLKIVDDVLEGAAPDLAVIAFGMNDGTCRVPKEEYAANIAAIMERIRQANGEAEYILVAPMLANPETAFSGNQDEYVDELLKLREASGGSVAVADMTTVHRELLLRKSYTDLTGNNVNHPNDFLIRCYAQVLLALIAGENWEGVAE